jgi:hypothetical protein
MGDAGRDRRHHCGGGQKRRSNGHLGPDVWSVFEAHDFDFRTTLIADIDFNNQSTKATAKVGEAAFTSEGSGSLGRSSLQC